MCLTLFVPGRAECLPPLFLFCIFHVLLKFNNSKFLAFAKYAFQNQIEYFLLKKILSIGKFCISGKITQRLKIIEKLFFRFVKAI